MATFETFQSHLAANEVDISKTPVTLGPWLKMDTEKEEFVGGFPAKWANEMLKRDYYRKPFVVPEKV